MYNTGQSAVVVKDLAGKEYPAIAAVNRKRRVNGQREISLSFLYTEINKDFINEMDFHWKVLFGGEWYTVINPGKQTDGDYLQVNVTAVLSFFVTLNGYYLQDKAENKSMTPANFFRELFNGTPYNFVIVNNLTANTLSYEDNQSKTERFLYAIERFNAEYIVRGNTVYIHTLIGSDKDVILHEDLNVNSVSIDVDASGFHTWARGYGDLPEEPAEGEEEKYRLEITYRSPLANKFGEIEGPAIKDGNYKIAANLTDAVKNQVENSYTISTEVDVVDLSNNGYPEMVLEEGDRVWLVVSKLNLNQQVRVVEIDETFDWEGNLINAKYTVGNEGIAARYKADQYNTLKDFKDILTGKKKIAVDWLPDAIKRASDIINGNLDSHFKYGAGEIIGINRNNPNGYMRFNTDGLGFSRDGGKTYRSAITYEGIVADAITTGTLRGVLIEGVDIFGSTITSEKSGDPLTYTRISGSTIWNRGKYQRTWKGQTRTVDSQIQIANGYMRFSDIDRNAHLGFSSQGISTYLNGDGEGMASGTIEFFSQRYGEPGQVGITMTSNYGALAMETSGVWGGDIILNPRNGYFVEARGPLKIEREIRSLSDRMTFMPVDNDTHLNIGVSYDSVDRKHPAFYSTLNDTGYLGLDNSYLRGAYINNISYQTLTQKSSERFKGNIQAVDKPQMRDIVSRLKVHSFNYHTTEVYSSLQKHFGFLAEESPDEILSLEKDSVVIGNILSIAVGAIQDLQDRVSTLEGN